MKSIPFLLFLLAGTYGVYAQEKANDEQSRKTQAQKVVYTEAMLLHTLTNSTGTQVLQIGNYNTVNAESKQMQVTQTGNYQLLHYTETSKLQPSNLNVNMQGMNNYIEIQGNNSITENMTINMSGNDRTLIIRNYR